MFDPIISLNVHIALLTARDQALKPFEESKGLVKEFARIVGQTIQHELEKSRQNMKHNKMWVDDVPVRERRYRYAHLGHRSEYEISRDDLRQHLGIVLRSLEYKIEQTSITK
ncbi:hypothetical protein GZH47_05400 [Paenibacillus rhizovicinus]|uniref:Uncharacterized protein n=1 Tax=Paenibacillus rhizovicinus TaxID=2704463 RepID=A0A6C0NVU7_9BACL|nr:hypothetical protein [Paenibacillus rhizovicinus]QHW30334.1 hypothetical protein GZH47_05400 [Paenibacillus rhizovicinus]